MKIYELKFTMKNSEPPFKLEYEFGEQSGDLLWIIPKFLSELFEFISKNKVNE